MSKKFKREIKQFTNTLNSVALTCDEKQSMRKQILAEAGVVKSPSRFWSLNYLRGRVKDYICMKMGPIVSNLINTYKVSLHKSVRSRAF